MKESKRTYPLQIQIIISLIRILIGWHFLYEGISKLATPGWSSASYLMDSKWLFSGIFHQIIGNPSALAVVDFLNVWGLILIGVGLFLGLFTRIASISGLLLLLLYYVASPPFVFSKGVVDGHYFIINKNLIEAAMLLLIATLRKDTMYGLDNYLEIIWVKRKEQKFPKEMNHEIPEQLVSSRREMIKNLAVVPFMGGAFFGMAKKQGWLSFEEKNLANVDAVTSASMLTAKNIDLSQLKGEVPKGKIKHLELSRIIPGGNLVSGFAHSRDLVYVSPLIKTYFTDEKIIETLWIYEACGINATIMRTDENTIRVLKEYRRRGGKIQWLAQTYPKGKDLSNIQLAIDNGAVGAFVMGNIADQIVYENRLEDLVLPIEFIRKNGLIGGVAAHYLKVPQTCMEQNIEVDFFMKTFHHDNYWSAHPVENRRQIVEEKENYTQHDKFHDNLWCVSADETKAFFDNCEVPWIAYKVLAAGAIKPQDGIRFAYENGADFTCVGMFDFQVIENANIVHDTLNSSLKRERKWFA
ncbi:DoxX family membrane protein [Maribellus comscasis]|uniref:DoxX family membrane protein n=1 Tax=Maribellus comscasis TaxID=2681766 RepID=A0A6I6JNZ8_9BACT|nr:DoxX family membrane protein [Maribellus comscasis]QGY42798.1 DoxX family membrane protein [Maribellus comscasis]